MVVCMWREAVWLSVCRGKQCGCLYVEGSSVVVYVQGSSVVVCGGKQCGCLYVEGSSVVVCM